MTNIIQLNSGQFLVGNTKTGDDGTVQIENPFEVIIQQARTPDGQVVPQAGLVPYAIMCKNRNFEFKKDQVQLGPVEAEEECGKAYTKMTSGIELASASDLPASDLLLKGS